MLTRYRGRHAATRRHVVTPVVLTGLLVATAASVTLPAAANAFSAPQMAAEIAAPLSAGASADATPKSTPEASSEAAPAAASTYRVVRGLRIKATPKPTWMLPVRGYHLTGRFGQSSGLWSSTHTGLDFAAPEGSSIRSVAPGMVVSTGYDGAYGNKTVVRLLDGTDLWYCHQSDIAVHPGQRIVAGQQLGSVGSTGNTTGPHLHLEVHPHDGAPVDPDSWLEGHHLHP
jgi:murein DD-endopeptidase MepM/ murein hydrolase activator NlpD